MQTLLSFVIVVVLAAAPAKAQGDDATPLTLRDAIARVLNANPRLAGQRFDLVVADAARDQAALRPPLELGVDAENIFGTDRLSALGDTELTLSLGTVIEMGDKRDLRITAADRDRDLVLTEFDAERLDVIAEATRRFVHFVAAERALALSAQSRALAASTRDAVIARVAAGRATALERQNAEIALTRVEIEAKGADAERLAAWRSLAGLWNDAGPVRSTAAELFLLPELAPLSALEILLDQNPDLGRFATERRVAEARVRLADAAARPDITVGAGLRRLQGDRSNALTLSLSVPLGSVGRAAPGAAEARGRLQQIDAREKAARSDLLITLAGTHIEATRRMAEVDQLRTVAVPQAETAVKLAEEGYAAGRYSLLELHNAQAQSVELQREAIAAATAYHLAVVEIERLTARAVTTSSSNLPSN